MESTFFLFFAGIVLIMLFGAFNSSQRKSGSHSDIANPPDTSDFTFQHHHFHHHHGHVDHGGFADFSPGDSGSCDSGGCDGGGGGCD